MACIPKHTYSGMDKNTTAELPLDSGGFIMTLLYDTVGIDHLGFCHSCRLRWESDMEVKFSSSKGFFCP